MLRRELAAATARGADHQWAAGLASEHVTNLAAWLTIWSIASRLKLTVIISTTGRPPMSGIERNNERTGMNRRGSRRDMVAKGLNHVSISAEDIAGSIRFYSELFGAEPIPTPNFGLPVQWLRLGVNQLHLFQRPGPAPDYHHFAVTVGIDDLASTYERAANMDIFDRTAFGHHLYELPGDWVQLYLRDPGGNLVEVDAPGASRVSGALRAAIKPLADVNPQSPEQQRATLF
jgi:catechol 2,3-dioxygenase-like lactoylglutathione lyase family enzyme